MEKKTVKTNSHFVLFFIYNGRLEIIFHITTVLLQSFVEKYRIICSKIEENKQNPVVIVRNWTANILATFSFDLFQPPCFDVTVTVRKHVEPTLPTSLSKSIPTFFDLVAKQ